MSTALFTLMNTFVRVVSAGSLSAAAKQLNASQPTVSRHLMTLESHVGVQLISRSTHGMSLTEAGQRYYEHTRGILDELAAFDSDLRNEATSPRGLLRVVVPTAFGQDWLVEIAARYFTDCPSMQIEWQLSDASLRFAEDGVDCVIRVGALQSDREIARRLGEVRRIVVAAPSYLQRCGDIAGPRDLASLQWISLSPYYRNEITLFDAFGNETTMRISPRFRTNHVLASRSAALNGIGLVLISEWAVRADLEAGRLYNLVPKWAGTSVPIYLIYPRQRFYAPKLRAFVKSSKASFLDISRARPWQQEAEEGVTVTACISVVKWPVFGTMDKLEVGRSV